MQQNLQQHEQKNKNQENYTTLSKNIAFRKIK